jgi:hypothetical protein
MKHKMSKKEEYDVTVLSRDEVTTYPKLGQAEITVMTTYVAAGLAPHTINILKTKWTDKAEKEAIRKDIQERLAKRPETFKV